jgi:hypothetical protein
MKSSALASGFCFAASETGICCAAISTVPSGTIFQRRNAL